MSLQALGSLAGNSAEQGGNFNEPPAPALESARETKRPIGQLLYDSRFIPEAAS